MRVVLDERHALDDGLRRVLPGAQALHRPAYRLEPVAGADDRRTPARLTRARRGRLGGERGQERHAGGAGDERATVD